MGKAVDGYEKGGQLTKAEEQATTKKFQYSQS